MLSEAKHFASQPRDPSPSASSIWRTSQGDSHTYPRTRARSPGWPPGSSSTRSSWPFALFLLALTVLAGLASPRTAAVFIPTGPVPPLRVGMDPSFLPFEFYPGPDEPPLGYDVDLAHAIGPFTGREVVIVPTAYDSLVDGLRAGQLDLVISAFPYDPRLTQDLVFTGAYFNAGPVRVVRAGQPAPDVPQRLAVELGTASDAAARRLKPAPASVLRLASPEAVIEAVTSGQADMALLDMVTALQAGPGVEVVGKPVEDEFYVIATRKDLTALFSQVNLALETLRRQGYLDELAVKWMGRAAP